MAGYLAGTFPTADIVTRYASKPNGEKAIDLRATGTGNPGTLNAAKVLGWKWGAVVLAGDALKGALASLAGRALAGDNGSYAAGSGAVIGHWCPVWNGFRGGKGVATSAGTALVCFPGVHADRLSAGGRHARALAWEGRDGDLCRFGDICRGGAVIGGCAQKGNAWGPKPTVGLPLYALSSSAIIAYRFLTAPSVPPQSATG